ncbi:MAG: FG-GAP repeat domain-containing protein [Acidimicrobiia bacterium]
MFVSASSAQAATGSFGAVSPGAGTATPGRDYKFGSVFPLTESATVSSFAFYARGGQQAQAFKPVIYAVGPNGTPDALVATGDPVTVDASQPAGWVTTPLRTATLPAGEYVLALLSGERTAGASIYYTAATSAGYYNGNPFAVPSATWGNVIRENRRWSFSVGYENATTIAPVNTAPPSITGTTTAGSTLTTTTGVWLGDPAPSVTVKWQQCTSICIDIPNATEAQYTLSDADAGTTVKVVATATNTAGTTVATSEATATVQARPAGGFPAFDKYVIDADPPAAIVEKTFADLDNDGRPDAVIGLENPSPGGIYWYEFPHSGNPADAWNKHTIVGSGDAYEDMTAIDVDGDGRLDIVASIAGSINWYRNPGTADGTWAATTIGAGYGESTMAIADIDGDGRWDLVTNSMIFFQNSESSWTSTSISTSFRGTALLDIGSGHGAINVVTTGSGPDFSPIWIENPRERGGNARTDAWTPHVVGAGYECASMGTVTSQCPDGYVGVHASADLNHDGRMDIVVAQSEVGDYQVPVPGGLKWFEAPSDRTAAWTMHTIDAGFEDAHNIQIADVDANGSVDVIAGEQDQSTQKRIAVFYNDGHGTFTRQVLSNDATHNIAIADAGDDGDIDLLTSPHGFYGAAHPLEVFINRRIP